MQTTENTNQNKEEKKQNYKTTRREIHENHQEKVMNKNE